MADITIWGGSYTDAKGVDLPKTGGGTARFMDTSPTTATASDVGAGKYFFNASGVLTLGTGSGGIPSVTQDQDGYLVLDDDQGQNITVESLTVSGSGTYTAPTGKAYSPVTVPAGTAGTPSATKGTVSNHSVSVTPSVTNTSGYITGSTKTGTAVTVSASELVSGDKSITANGTNIDVADYATVSVNVSGGGGSNGYTLTTVLPQQTITVGSDRQATPTDFTGLVAGEDYLITYDGVQYVSTCGVAWTNNCIVGDIQVVWATTDITYPFAVVYVDQNDKLVFCSTTGSHTIKIEHMELLDPSPTWSWMGKNPTLVQAYTPSHVKLSATSLGTWTWGTGSTSLVTSQNYSPAITVDITSYDYIQVVRFSVHYDYGNWTPVSAPEDFANEQAYAVFGYCSTRAAAEAETPDAHTGKNFSSESRLYYWNSSGSDAYYSAGYGLYTANITGYISSGNKVTFASPVIYVRGNASYFSQTAFGNLDLDESYYDLACEVWRVDAGTSVPRVIHMDTVDILNNGL